MKKRKKIHKSYRAKVQNEEACGAMNTTCRRKESVGSVGADRSFQENEKDTYPGVSCACLPLLHRLRYLYLAFRPWALVLRMTLRSCQGVECGDYGCCLLDGVTIALASSSPPLSPPPLLSTLIFVPAPVFAPTHVLLPSPVLLVVPVSALVPVSRHDFLFIIPVALISPRYHVVGQALCVALEASDYLQVPSPVYKDYAARGKEVPGLLFGLFLI